MVFDDDAKLIGLYQNYEEEPTEMKRQIVKYICSDTFADAVQFARHEQDHAEEKVAATLDDVS